jgi:tungstate transport system ATP-binding protein
VRKSERAAAILPLAVKELRYELGGKRLLDEISFALQPGPCSVILGPNGAGKSLILRLCHGLLRPSRGSIEWCGPGAADASRQLAMVFQRPVLLRRSVAANVDYAMRLRGIPSRQRAARSARVLQATGLEALADRGARRLSVGEQQRIALARAWALRPQVLLLDEPAASLDPGASRALESAIRAIREDGTKIVMTTHDMAQARRMADEVLFLHRGRLLEQTLATDFFESPASTEARAFLQGELLW